MTTRAPICVPRAMRAGFMSRKALLTSVAGSEQGGRARSASTDHLICQAPDASDLEATDDLQVMVPITPQELDAIETYLAGLLSGILETDEPMMRGPTRDAH